MQLAQGRGTLWPVGLAVFYPHRWGAYPLAEIVGAVLLLAIMTFLAIFTLRRIPALVFGWCFFLGTLFPLLGFFQAREYSIADHYAYVPLIGLFVIAVWGSMDFPWTRPWGKKLVVGLFALLIIVCLAASRRQISYWRNDLTLFTHAIKVTENNATAHYHLGLVAYAEGRRAEAIEQFKKTIDIDGGMAEAHYNLGVLLSLEGKFPEAERRYRTALWINPRHAAAHYCLGELLFEQGRLQEAEAEARTALTLAPQDGLAHFTLGIILERVGKRAAAVEEYRASVRLKPDFRPARDRLADLERLGSGL